MRTEKKNGEIRSNALKTFLSLSSLDEESCELDPLGDAFIGIQ